MVACFACQVCGVRLDPRIRLRVCVEHGWEAPPNSPQEKFLASPVYEKLYGGAAGGGKTDALLIAAAKRIAYPSYVGIIFRRTYPELLGKLIPRSKEIYPWFGGKYNSTQHVWTFPSGARIHFGQLQHADSVHDYQGWEFQFVGFDELTTFLESQYRYILSRVRSAFGIVPEVCAATNPGGEGHEWVLDRWAPWLRYDDPDYKGPRCEPGEPCWYVTRDGVREWIDEVTAQRYNKAWREADPLDRADLPRALQSVFIPSLLEDNPHLLLNDPEYAARLNDLDAHTQRQLKRGDWLSKPARGDFFKKEWFTLVDDEPSGHIVYVRWWDRAATQKKEDNDPDYTASIKLGLLDDGRYFIDDGTADRIAVADVTKKMESTAQHDGKDVMVRGAQDPGQAGVFEASILSRVFAGYDVEFIRETGDKASRAKPVAAQAKAGNILVRRAPWNRMFFDQLENFPVQGHDDYVDALSGAFSVLNSEDALAANDWSKAMRAVRARG